MFEIELTDLKGDCVRLVFTREYRMSRMGLIEVFCWANKDWLQSYAKIPVPVFVEWFYEAD